MSQYFQPRHWVKSSLGEIGAWGSGGTPKRTNSLFYGGSIPWLVIGDLNDSIVTTSKDTITEAGLKNSSAKLLDKETLLIAMYGSIGKLGITGIKCATNQAIASCSVDPAIANLKFVFFYLLSQRAELLRSGKGGAQKNISQTVLKAYDFPIAPLAEQKVIADKLDTLLSQVDNTKARLERIPKILKRFRQSVLAAAVSGRLTEEWRAASKVSSTGYELHRRIKDAHEANGGHARGNASKPTEEAHDLSTDDLPPCWDVAEMRDICVPGKPITYGILKPGPELEEGVPYIRVADFPGNKLNMANIKKTSIEIDQQFKRARLSEGDLLLSIRGSVGRLIKIPAALAGANITQDTARLSISPLVSTDFVYWVLLAESTQRRMKNATRGVAVRGINIGDVRALQIPLPPLAEQTEIVRRVDQLFAHADRIEQQVNNALARVNNLTQSILAKAFRGELTEQWRQDHADLISGENGAEALLERIKSERAAAAPARRSRKAKRRG
jgi:type I restriction enzyme, S subunit